MRISTKLTLALGLVSSCILGPYGVWQYRQEQSDLTRAAVRDFRTLSAAVRVAVENSMRDRQTADISEILGSLEVGEPEIDVLVVDPTGALAAHSSTAAQTSSLTQTLGPALRLAIDQGESSQRFETAQGVARLVGVFPLWKDDRRSSLGAVAIVRPLAALGEDLRRTLRTTVTTSLTLIAAITFVGWLLLRRYVRQPLEELSGAMRVIRQGDLTATLPARRRDELGHFTREFNRTVQELAQARQQLLAAAESRQQLEQALQHVDKLVTVGQLSAGLAHEIGSPLQILSGRARALAARTDLPPDVCRVARILEEQTVRITAIVEQLLDLARRKAPHMAEIPLDPPIAAIVELLEGEARRRGVRLEYRSRVDLPRVRADAAQVQQVIMNLVSNALRATPRNGRIVVSLTPSTLPAADALYEGPAVMLVVEDSGHGIAEAVRARIFEPFFTTWSEAGGTGLGLAVVQAIVTDHGGTIAVTPASDGGTRVVVQLPAVGRRHVRRVVA